MAAYRGHQVDLPSQLIIQVPLSPGSVTVTPKDRAAPRSSDTSISPFKEPFKGNLGLIPGGSEVRHLHPYLYLYLYLPFKEPFKGNLGLSYLQTPASTEPLRSPSAQAQLRPSVWVRQTLTAPRPGQILRELQESPRFPLKGPLKGG